MTYNETIIWILRDKNIDNSLALVTKGDDLVKVSEVDSNKLYEDINYSTELIPNTRDDDRSIFSNGVCTRIIHWTMIY